MDGVGEEGWQAVEPQGIIEEAGREVQRILIRPGGREEGVRRLGVWFVTRTEAKVRLTAIPLSYLASRRATESCEIPLPSQSGCRGLPSAPSLVVESSEGLGRARVELQANPSTPWYVSKTSRSDAASEEAVWMGWGGVGNGDT